MVSVARASAISPTLLLMLRVVVHDLFVKSAVNASVILINLYVHYSL